MGIFSSKGSKLVSIAEDNPAALAEHLGEMEDLIQANDEEGVLNGTFALKKLSEVNPSTSATLLHSCAERLDASHEGIRKNVISVMVEVAGEFPEEVAEYNEQLARKARTDSDPFVRGTSLEALVLVDTGPVEETLEKVKKSDSEAKVREFAMELSREYQVGTPSENSEEGKTGMLESCNECSTDFGELGGIPRRCPGCGSEIKRML